jgi:predicted dehydrogenase
MIRVGLIGAGRAAKSHARAISAADGATVTAVASRTGPEGFVDRLGLSAEPLTDPERLCSKADVDAVVVATPTHLHADHIALAVGHGLDILCEKPVVRKADQLASMLPDIEDAGIVFLPGHILRYRSAFNEIRELLRGGEIGDVRAVSARRLSPFPEWGSDDWFAEYDKSGGVLMDMAIHDLDFVDWAVGDITAVTASKTTGDGSDHGVVTAECANGATATIEASWAQPTTRPFTATFEAVGSEGAVRYTQRRTAFDGGSTDEVGDDRTGETVRIWIDDGEFTRSIPSNNAWEQELSEFLACIRTDRSPRTSLRESLRAIEIADAANAAARSGHPIRIE